MQAWWDFFKNIKNLPVQTLLTASVYYSDVFLWFMPMVFREEGLVTEYSTDSEDDIPEHEVSVFIFTHWPQLTSDRMW